MSQLLTLALAGQVIVNIGQLADADTKALTQAVRAGTLIKWRGHWYPIAGADFGIGPLKTCYGTPEARAAIPDRA
jgi:hypothetical protein